MGAAGIVAILGIKNEMEQGTATGRAYTAGLDTLKADLGQLEAVAASGVLRPFQQVVQDITQKMPQLSGQIGELAGVAGRTASSVATGLVAAFLALEPLMRDSAVYVQNLAGRFAALMSGPGVASFGDYVRSVFPQVMADVENIVGAVIHLVAALAPLGGGALTGLNLLATLINAIPVDKLAGIATAASAVYLGFQAWSGIKALISGVEGQLVSLKVAEEGAITGMRGLQIASGVIGVAIAALSVLFMNQAEAQRQATQDSNDFSDALRKSNGVVDESVQSLAREKLAKSGAIDQAKEFGISVSTMTAAVMGNSTATATANAALTAWAASQGAAGADSAVITDKINGFRQALGLTSTALESGVQGYRDLAAATAVSTGATSGQAAIQQVLAERYGTTVAVLGAVTGAQAKNADAAATATFKMQAENDAAGLLKQSLDLLSGAALGSAQAQQRFDSATVSLTNSTKDANGNIDRTKTSIDGMSDAAVANRGSLLNLVQAAQGVAEATAKQTGSTEQGRQKFAQMREQIINNAAATGMNRDNVAAFIDEVAKVPESVPPTVVSADTAAGLQRIEAFRAALNSLQNRTISVTTVNTSITQIDSGAYAGKQVSSTSANGNIFKAFAAGGFENHVAQISNGATTRIWGEPETGGEAYIPLASSKRARSTAILAETNQIMGNPLGAGAGASGPMEIHGTLDLGDGLVGMVRGFVQRAEAAAGMAMRAGG